MKLYVQLRPDDDGIKQLQLVQASLQPPVGKSIGLVKASTMHLTVLHIGAVDRLLDSMADFTDLSRNKVVTYIDELATDLESVVNDTEGAAYTLQPTGYQRFGASGSTYVISLQSTPELDNLYDKSLAVLKEFFVTCGIADVEAFMSADSNLKYALSLRPHVTVAKGYVGQDSTTELKPITFSIMPVRYDS